MIRSTGAQVALLALGVTLLAGLFAGNSPTTVLWRALVAMVIALTVTQAVAWTNKLILRDHLQRRKLSIDREHLGLVRAMAEEQEQDEEELAELEEEAPIETTIAAEAG
ncbi:MAG: hypothetical protein KKB50_13665 [Planctomycetes bacterium]|nr:hypothetical protein [Planctomycetota bacterium]